MMGGKGQRLLTVAGGILALLFLSIIARVGIFFLNRPAFLMPDTAKWHTGDIFFSVGDSWESVAVRALTGAKYFELADSTPSHCGVVVRDAGKVKLVHESTVAKRIVAETVEEYFANNGSYCLYARRVCPTPDSTRLRQTVDSLIAKAIPFDFDFDHANGEKLYCTEMVIQVLERCGNSCLSTLKEQSYIYPEDLLKMCVSP